MLGRGRLGASGAFVCALLAARLGKAEGEAAAPQAGAAACGGASVVAFDGGAARAALCPDEAAAQGLTVLDLADGWLPGVFSETPDRPLPLRRYLQDLASERFGRGGTYASARRDRHFELFGVAPAIAVVRARLLDGARHACHDAVADGPLAAQRRALGRGPGGDPARRAAVRVVEAHLACDGLLPRGLVDGRFDKKTAEALLVFQRRHMLVDHGRVDLETKGALVADSRELDFRALLRALRERAADAAGLIEDGSASGGPGEVLGRQLDNEEIRAALGRVTAVGAPEAPGLVARAGGGTILEASTMGGAVLPATSAAPDLVSAAAEAAARALGWTSPEAAAAALAAGLPAQVAVRLPPRPAYHAAHMELRAEVDRGDVSLAPPRTKSGRSRARANARRPTLTLYARAAGGEIALVRWPTTIGGWKPQERRDGTVALKYKESRVGAAVWRDLLALPTWRPPPGIPTRKLLVRTRGGWAVKREPIGPGYRASYGLVALMHHQLVPGLGEGGGDGLVDYRIRTHGTPAWRSVIRGESHGCHRLYNHLVVRLAGFLLRHREHVRHGVVRDGYARTIEYQGREIALEADARGYRYELTPPVPVNVLEGAVHGPRRLVTRALPLAAGR